MMIPKWLFFTITHLCAAIGGVLLFFLFLILGYGSEP